MNVLGNRLSLGRQQCEERRRYVAELELLARRLRADGWRLREEIERAVAAGTPVFAEPLLDRHGRLARSVAAIDAQIAETGNALAAAEWELKRYELASAQRAGVAELSERRRAPRFPRTPPASPAIAGPDRGS
jgi:hypothetical protein